MAGIVESDGFLAPGRTCDFGRLRPLALHRVPPAGFESGVLRGDGFGDEWGGGISWSFFIGSGEGVLESGERGIIVKKPTLNR